MEQLLLVLLFYYTGCGFGGLGPMLSVLLRETSCISRQSRWKCHAILGEFDIFVWFSSFALFSVGFESFLRSLERIAWSAQPVPKESKAV